MIIPNSVAFIPTFLRCTLSSATSSMNKAGFFLAYNSISLLSSLELILDTLVPNSTLITASAVSMSRFIAKFRASNSSSNQSISLAAFSALFTSKNNLSLKG